MDSMKTLADGAHILPSCFFGEKTARLLANVDLNRRTAIEQTKQEAQLLLGWTAIFVTLI